MGKRKGGPAWLWILLVVAGAAAAGYTWYKYSQPEPAQEQVTVEVSVSEEESPGETMKKGLPKDVSGEQGAISKEQGPTQVADGKGVEAGVEPGGRLPDAVDGEKEAPLKPLPPGEMVMYQFESGKPKREAMPKGVPDQRIPRDRVSSDVRASANVPKSPPDRKSLETEATPEVQKSPAAKGTPDAVKSPEVQRTQAAQASPEVQKPPTAQKTPDVQASSGVRKSPAAKGTPPALETPGILTSPEAPKPSREVADDAYDDRGRRYCEMIEQYVQDYFQYLDTKKFIRNLKPSQTSYGRFKQVMGRLAAKPPIPAGEGVDPAIMVKNIYFFCRALDKKDLNLIKEVVAQDRDLLEDNMGLFFQWLMLGKSCPNPGGVRPSFNELYRYAGFFLNTTGGRAYMFRRGLKVRLLVSFYAVQIAYQADKAGRNPYGIHVLPYVRMLTEEMGNYSDLIYKENYLKTLGKINAYYANRR